MISVEIKLRQGLLEQLHYAIVAQIAYRALVGVVHLLHRRKFASLDVEAHLFISIADRRIVVFDRRRQVAGNDLARVVVDRKHRQTLRVAMSNWRASTLLPSILPAFSQEHPEAHLELLERPTSEMFRLVADNTVDFAIMNTNLNTPDYLTTETILYEKILLVGNRGNRAAQALAEACRAGREPELTVLEHERFVLLYPEILLAMRVNNFLEREHITVENALYTTNATTALNLTAENYGFCFVNETAVHNAPNRGELLFFDLDSPDLVHPLSVVYKKKRHLLPAARAFVDAARRFLQSQSWRSECDCRVEHGRPV